MDVGVITQQMRELGWVLGDRLGEGGGGFVHLCYSAKLADDVSIGIQKIASIVAPIAGGTPSMPERSLQAQSSGPSTEHS